MGVDLLQSTVRRAARRACARLGRVDLAQDVEGEAWVRALPRLKQVRQPEAYLRQVVRSAAADLCATDGAEMAARRRLAGRLRRRR